MMPLQAWSDRIVLLELGDEPQFSDDLQAMEDRFATQGPCHVAVNLAAMRRFNSSNLTALLRLRQQVTLHGKRLQLCCVPDPIWGMMLTTGLDKVFTCSPDVHSALASLQLET